MPEFFGDDVDISPWEHTGSSRYGEPVEFVVNTRAWLNHMVGVKRHIRDKVFLGVEEAMQYAADAMKFRIEPNIEGTGKEWTLYHGSAGDYEPRDPSRPKVTWVASAWGDIGDPEPPVHFHAVAAAQGYPLDYPSIVESFEAGAEFLPGHIWVMGWVRNDAPHAGIIEFGGEAGWGVIMPRYFMRYVMTAPHHVDYMMRKIATTLSDYLGGRMR